MFRLIPIVVFLANYSLGLRALFQRGAFSKNGPLEPEENGGKYIRSQLSREESCGYFNQIIFLVEKDKLFINPNLILRDIADQMPISRTYVSQIINENSGCNFYDFINTYRVEEVKKCLADENKKNKCILDCALNAGFKSKATFNTIFKKETGQTPSQYRKSFLSGPSGKKIEKKPEKNPSQNLYEFIGPTPYS